MLKEPFRPLKLFKHPTQSIFSKTKGFVDDARQQRAVLLSSISHMVWELKLLPQVVRTASLNVLFSWRVFEKRNLLQSFEEFKSLVSYRNALNKVRSTRGFMFEESLEFLSYAKYFAERRSEDIR